MKGSGKRVAASPLKNPGGKKAQKALSFDEEAYQYNMHDMDETPGATGGALIQPPQWFIDFEKRQDQRFDKVFGECKELIDSMKIEYAKRLAEMNGNFSDMSKKVKDLEKKLDDLENRSRRCNVVIFNIPEGEEGPDCNKFISELIETECEMRVTIQRAHRTGVRKADESKPRPIHVGFTFFQQKEACRRKLAEVFKKKMFGKSSAKLFVSNDFSQKVQEMRREKMPEVRRLREEGKQAFLVYPATIKIRDSQGNVRNP